MTNGIVDKEGVVTWRRRAAGVVEELFRATEPAEWDSLLELRELVLRGSDWGEVLDQFLECRRRLERDHYLPFYRLRRLLEGHLRLVTQGAGETGARTAGFALWRHRGMDDLREEARRAHRVDDNGARPAVAVTVAVVERAG